MALKTTCIKNIIFKIIKIKTVCQYIGNFYYCENLKWAAQNLQLGHMRTRPMGRGLDIAALDKAVSRTKRMKLFFCKNVLQRLF